MAEPSDVLKVEHSSEAFASCLRAITNFESGKVICRLTGVERGPKHWSSLQCGTGPGDHVKVTSELLYVNHSCQPNALFDVSSPNPDDWQFRALKDIAEGDVVTAFYPSTEWEMNQPFQCKCGAKTCLGLISGARELSREELNKRGPVSPHILQLVKERDMDKC